MQRRLCFRVSGNLPKKLRTVYAANYKQAANWAARKLFGYCTIAVRIWPENWPEHWPEYSGYFQSYQVIAHTNEVRRIGNPFHLQMERIADSAHFICMGNYLIRLKVTAVFWPMFWPVFRPDSDCNRAITE